MANELPHFPDSTLNATADTAEAAVRAAGDAASALIDRWVANGNAAAVQAIADRGAGAARKAARRGLNILKSRGVKLPALAKKASLVPAESRPVEAWMLSPDAAGIRLLAFSKGLPDGSCQTSLVYLRDGQGVLQVENALSTPTRLRTALGRLLPGCGYEAVKVPLEWARDKVARARRVHTERGLPEPLGLTSASPLLTPVPQSSPEHPFDAEGFEFADEDAIELASDSGSLHHLPEFRAWLPAQGSVQELLVAVGKQLNPDATPDSEQVSELLKTEMLAATDRYFTSAMRDDLVECMKDAGVSLITREGEEAALKVAATIQVVRRCTDLSNPPNEVPFLRAFFEKAISVLMAQRGGKLEFPIPKPSAEALSAP